MGKEGVATEQMMDPGALFAMLFGRCIYHSALCHYLGKLDKAKAPLSEKASC